MRVEMLIGWYEVKLREEGYKPGTIHTRSSNLSGFVLWLQAQGIEDTRDITRETVSGYCQWLRTAVSETTHERYTPLTIKGKVSAVRGLFERLYDAGIMEKLILPPALLDGGNRPLLTLLSEAEVATLLETMRGDTAMSLRDRALFEVIYGSGLRSSEAGKLTWEVINLDARRAVIRQSKFDKDRVVPLTHEAVEMLKRYEITQGRKSAWVFPGSKGRGLSPVYINKRFKRYCVLAGIYRPGLYTHQLRHACATHLIAHGASLRYVQELLGHESIQTTVRYTREQQDEVQKAHRRYHPRENLLYETVGEEYEKRLAVLAERLRESKEKTLAKKAKRRLH
jgi:site-specific recombinase XerD